MSLQLSTEAFYRDFPTRAVPADVHGILLRVASLADTLAGKIKAWSEPGRRPSKRLKDLADIARLCEAHPHVWASLPDDVKPHVPAPGGQGDSRRWMTPVACPVLGARSIRRRQTSPGIQTGGSDVSRGPSSNSSSGDIARARATSSR